MTKLPQLLPRETPSLSKANEKELRSLIDRHEVTTDRLEAARTYLAKLKEEVPSLNVESYLDYLAKRES